MTKLDEAPRPGEAMTPDLDELERMVAEADARAKWLLIAYKSLSALIERVRRAETLLRRVNGALAPFAECVSDDKGNLTVSDTWVCDFDDFCNAYFETKLIDAHFTAYEPAKEVET